MLDHVCELCLLDCEIVFHLVLYYKFATLSIVHIVMISSDLSWIFSILKCVFCVYFNFTYSFIFEVYIL